MFSKFELIGALASVGLMALALFLIRVENLGIQNSVEQSASVVQSGGLVVVGADDGDKKTRSSEYLKAVDENGNFKAMVVDDIKIGTGAEVKEGNVVSVHYIGTLQSGEEFDNSHKRGVPFEFKVGGGQVIKGWEEGLVGMKVGGQRVLVIPPEKAYGEQGIGPIPPNSTLVFAIELLEIK